MKLYASTTLKTLFSKTSVDQIFLDQFQKADDADKLAMINQANLGVLVRLSLSNAELEAFCKRADLKSSWEKLWSTYGLVLSRQQQLGDILFHPHPRADHFDLVRGAYFFHASQKIKTDVKIDFTLSEIKCLEHASDLGSVHAIQRYNEFLYKKIESAEDKEKDDLYNKIIDNSKRMLPDHGAYGYMALTQALGFYGLWLLEKGQTIKGQQIYDKAMVLTDRAASILEKSKFSIHNASLGRGLKVSNSFGIDTPEAAKKLLEEKFELCRLSASTPPRP